MVGGSFSYDLVEWDVETGREMRRLEGHNNVNIRLSFNPEGTRSLSSGLGGTLILWGWPEGIALRRIDKQGIASETVVSPDGRSALSAVDNTIIHRDITTPTLEERNDWIRENRYVRELTCQERELYRVEPLCEEG